MKSSGIPTVGTRFMSGNSGPYEVNAVTGNCASCRDSRGDILPLAVTAWATGVYDIIDPAIIAEPTCTAWCGLPYGDKRVPSPAVSKMWIRETTDYLDDYPAYCSQACLDRATTKPAPVAVVDTPQVKAPKPEPVTKREWKASVDLCAPHRADEGTRVTLALARSIVARLPPMPPDTSRTMASREPRWKTMPYTKDRP